MSRKLNWFHARGTLLCQQLARHEVDHGGLLEVVRVVDCRAAGELEAIASGNGEAIGEVQHIAVSTTKSLGASKMVSVAASRPRPAA